MATDSCSSVTSGAEPRQGPSRPLRLQHRGVAAWYTSVNAALSLFVQMSLPYAAAVPTVASESACHTSGMHPAVLSEMKLAHPRRASLPRDIVSTRHGVGVYRKNALSEKRARVSLIWVKSCSHAPTRSPSRPLFYFGMMRSSFSTKQLRNRDTRSTVWVHCIVYIVQFVGSYVVFVMF